MTVVLAGLAVGAIYGLIAIGYNITFITSSILNFAYANIVMAGGFVGWWLLSRGAPAALAVLAAAAVGAVVGAIEERVAIRMLPRLAVGHGELVTTVGFATLVTGVLILIWGDNVHAVTYTPATRVVKIVGGRTPVGNLVLVVLVVALGVGAHVWNRRTRYGIASLAITEDREAAMLRGINVRTLSLVGFFVAGAVGGLVGPLVATVTTAAAYTALVLAVKGFIALTIGGVGHQIGAIAGGLIIGLTEAVSGYYENSSTAGVAVFAVFLLVVMVRPAGIFGQRVVRSV
jgi:branched-chain amino acid transport system permease protein